MYQESAQIQDRLSALTEEASTDIGLGALLSEVNFVQLHSRMSFPVVPVYLPTRIIVRPLSYCAALLWYSPTTPCGSTVLGVLDKASFRFSRRPSSINQPGVLQCTARVRSYHHACARKRQR
jgi:hypothetical protein